MLEGIFTFVCVRVIINYPDFYIHTLKIYIILHLDYAKTASFITDSGGMFQLNRIK